MFQNLCLLSHHDFSPFPLPGFWALASHHITTTHTAWIPPLCIMYRATPPRVHRQTNSLPRVPLVSQERPHKALTLVPAQVPFPLATRTPSPPTPTKWENLFYVKCKVCCAIESWIKEKTSIKDITECEYISTLDHIIVKTYIQGKANLAKY